MQTTEQKFPSVAELIAGGMHPAEAVTIDRDDAIALIKHYLKKRSGKTWSVTGGRGTAWGWITIQAPPKRRVAHLDNPDYHRDDPVEGSLPYTEVPPDENHGAWYLSEADSKELAELLGKPRGWVHCQGETIPASSAYRLEYVARAMGLDPIVGGTPYWD